MVRIARSSSLKYLFVCNLPGSNVPPGSQGWNPELPRVNRNSSACPGAISLTIAFNRMAARWGWLNAGQYQHAAVMVAELGQVVGGASRSIFFDVK